MLFMCTAARVIAQPPSQHIYDQWAFQNASPLQVVTNYGEIPTMLRNRLITGPLLSGALIALLYFDDQLGSVVCGCCTTLQPGLLIALLAMVVAPLVAIELGSIARGIGVRCNIGMIIISMEAWIATIYLLPSTIQVNSVIGLLCTLFIASFALSVVAISKNRDLKGVIAGATYTVATSAYVAMGIGMFLLLRRDHSAWWIIGVIAIVKMCDTGAFFVGRNFGKHKLIHWVSPAKTWEGLVGGLVTASLTAVGLAAANNHLLQNEPEIPLLIAALLGFLFGLLGQTGDLIMSIFKRDSGIKDTSSVLPGLGGMLDVLDSLLLVGPVAYWLLPNS